MDAMLRMSDVLTAPRYAAAIVSIILVSAGIFLLTHIRSESPLKPYILQIIGLLIILPVVLLIAVTLGIGNEATTGIVGMVIGYIFGASRVQQFSIVDQNVPEHKTP